MRVAGMVVGMAGPMTFMFGGLVGESPNTIATTWAM
jgi:hypothetical protein